MKYRIVLRSVEELEIELPSLREAEEYRDNLLHMARMLDSGLQWSGELQVELPVEGSDQKVWATVTS